jgi:hypothetical protein
VLQLRTKGLLFVQAWLVLEACSTNETTTLPANPIPANPCAPNFQYGYTDKPSYFAGEKVIAFLQANASVASCRLELFDMNGNVAHSIGAGLFAQSIAPNPSENGYGFLPTVSFEIPSTIKSGVYLIENKIPVIIKSKAATDLVIVYPSNTANAYENSGGKSLYSPEGRPVKVSFLRPISLQSNSSVCLKWFEQLNTVTIGYVADIDLDEFSAIEKSKIIVISGHSEYWTRKARENFDRFVNIGGHALILSGNTMWWQVRYSANGHEMYCHKEAALDPIADPKLKTINWYEPILEYSIIKSIGADFNRGGYGLKVDEGWDGFKICAPTSPLLQGMNFKRGEVLKLPSGEYDGAPIKAWESDGHPVLDNNELDFHKLELIGFDKGSRVNKETVGTFIVFQKTLTSGIVINTASYDWCSAKGMGGKDSEKIKTITYNSITKLLKGETVFSK